MARQSARLLTAILRPLVAEGIGSQHKVIQNKFLSKRYIHGAFNGGNQSSKFCNSFMTRERHFASRSKGGVDDEDIYDDVESRLMHDDDQRDDAYMDGMGYDVHGADYNASGEWDNAEAVSGDAEGAGSVDGEGPIEDSDEDSDESTANEMSDEEFEGGDQTDEELDELLANTPLFEPPEFPEFLRPGETVPEFSFRPEGPVYYPGGEYEPEELDITRPLPPRKRPERIKPEISVEEVIDNADFRNVRYLTKFITEAGNIIARKEFKMRTKSHNRIVKAIKTARFFGLMPYTNMGRPPFVFNEPFDELEDFYETDEEAQKFDNASFSGGYQGSFRNSTTTNGRPFDQGSGGYQGSVRNSTTTNGRPFDQGSQGFRGQSGPWRF